MPWFTVYDTNMSQLRCYPCLESAYMDQFTQERWSVRIQKKNLKTLNSKQLETFLLEVLKGLEAGLKLQEVLTYISLRTSQSHIAMAAQAIRDEISMGTPFNHCFKTLVDPALSGYCDLFLQKSTAEQLREHLAILYEQIHQLRHWTDRLQKSFIYPFFVIQFALIIWLLSQFLNQEKLNLLHSELAIYVIVTLSQCLLIYFFKSNTAIKLIETYLHAFRLNKLFNLLNASLKTGTHLQSALTMLPTNFNHKGIKQELLLVYYHLRLGESYLISFPTYWFPKESLLALEASCHSGDILRAIDTASHIHKENWLKTLGLIEKLCPLGALLIAGIFVTKTLISIYLPLINMG